MQIISQSKIGEIPFIHPDYLSASGGPLDFNLMDNVITEVEIVFFVIMGILVITALLLVVRYYRKIRA